MAALYAVLLKLKADGDAIISPTQGHHAYGLFLSLIRRSSLSMADETVHHITPAGEIPEGSEEPENHRRL